MDARISLKVQSAYLTHLPVTRKDLLSSYWGNKYKLLTVTFTPVGTVSCQAPHWARGMQPREGAKLTEFALLEGIAVQDEVLERSFATRGDHYFGVRPKSQSLLCHLLGQAPHWACSSRGNNAAGVIG